MSHPLPYATGAALRFAGWALTGAVVGDRLRVRVEGGGDGGEFEVMAPPGADPAALPAGTPVFVLVPEEGPGIAVSLAPARAASPTVHREGALIRLEDGDGALLFEYDRETRRTVLGVPVGDLEIRVAQGSLRLSAAEGVAVESPEIAVSAGRATARIGLLDLLAGRIRSRARVHRATVEETSELRVGKFRLFARLGVLLKGEKATVDAEGDVHLRGRMIRLN